MRNSSNSKPKTNGTFRDAISPDMTSRFHVKHSINQMLDGELVTLTMINRDCLNVREPYCLDAPDWIPAGSVRQTYRQADQWIKQNIIRIAPTEFFRFSTKGK